MEVVDEIKEFGGVITSSPLPTPRSLRPKVNASVPLLRATAYLEPQIFDMFFSNLSISPPKTYCPLDNTLLI